MRKDGTGGSENLAHHGEVSGVTAEDVSSQVAKSQGEGSQLVAKESTVQEWTLVEDGNEEGESDGSDQEPWEDARDAVLSWQGEERTAILACRALLFRARPPCPLAP